MKALVTGGCGFIGSHLTRKLVDRGFSVTAVDDLSAGKIENLADHNLKLRCVHSALVPQFFSKNVKMATEEVLVVTGDFVDRNVLNMIVLGKFTHVFHLAANPRVEFSVERPAISTEVNLMKSIELLSACRNIGLDKFIFASSSAVYGNGLKYPGTSLSECMVPMPVNPYGLQKLSFELFMRLFSDLYNLNSVALRLFNVYGPGCAGDSPYATAIAAWCDKLSKNEPLRSDGDGEQTRDMIYVEDVVEAFVRFATDYDEKGFAAVNVGTGGSISNNDILRKLQLKNLDFRIQNSPERPGDSKYTRAAINKLRKCLRWEPTTQFDEGLEKTLKWWKMI